MPARPRAPPVGACTHRQQIVDRGTASAGFPRGLRPHAPSPALGCSPILPGVIEVHVRRLDPEASIPAPARPGDAGVDLSANESVVLKAGGGRAIVPTGLAIAIPEGHAGFVQPRSGLARDHGVTVLNSPGLIDCGYRGELQILLVNTDPHEDFEVRRGERIAQLVIQRVEQVKFVLVDQLSDSERGTGGWGHSGR